MSEYLEERAIDCPYCGANFTIVIDLSAGSQQYIEDCAVCCRPIALAVAFDADGVPRVQAAREDET